MTTARVFTGSVCSKSGRRSSVPCSFFFQSLLLPSHMAKVKWEHFHFTFDSKKVGGKWRELKRKEARQDNLVEFYFSDLCKWRNEGIKSRLFTSLIELEISLICSTLISCKSSRQYFYRKDMKNSFHQLVLYVWLHWSLLLGGRPFLHFPVKRKYTQDRMCVSVLGGLWQKLSLCRRRRRAYAAVCFSCSQLSRAASLCVIMCDWQARFQQHANRKWP